MPGSWLKKYTFAVVRQILNGLKGKIAIGKLLKEVTRLSIPEYEARFKKWVADSFSKS